jgi:hypothetical protein
VLAAECRAVACLLCQSVVLILGHPDEGVVYEHGRTLSSRRRMSLSELHGRQVDVFCGGETHPTVSTSIPFSMAPHINVVAEAQIHEWQLLPTKENMHYEMTGLASAVAEAMDNAIKALQDQFVEMQSGAGIMLMRPTIYVYIVRVRKSIQQAAQALVAKAASAAGAAVVSEEERRLEEANDFTQYDYHIVISDKGHGMRADRKTMERIASLGECPATCLLGA